MPRAIWKGTLSFGLVEIPVALHPAVAREEEISFERRVRAGKTKEIKEIDVPKEVREGAPRGDVIDLMPLLERSLKRTSRSVSAAAPKRRAGGAVRRKGA